jgi:peptidoglycan/xylan/chitin deacetylase (PgdA/CDA1 family)
VPNTWGLAFHDGSSEQTGQLARFLKEHNITATFFLTGSNVAKNKEMIKEHLHGSHHLGSNTWSHAALTSLTNEQIVAEMKWTEMAVLEVTGLRLKYVRPPYGAIDDRVRFVLKAMGYVVVDWTKELDTTAWEVNSDELVTRFTASVKDYNSNNATTKGFINDDRTTSIAKELISSIMKWDTKGTKGHKGMTHHSKAHKATTHPSKPHRAITHPSKEAATKIPISFTSIPGCVNENIPYQIRNATTDVPTYGPTSTGLQNSSSSPGSVPPSDSSPSTNTASCLGGFGLAPFVAMVIASVFLA